MIKLKNPLVNLTELNDSLYPDGNPDYDPVMVGDYDASAWTYYDDVLCAEVEGLPVPVRVMFFPDGWDDDEGTAWDAGWMIEVDESACKGFDVANLWLFPTTDGTLDIVKMLNELPWHRMLDTKCFSPFGWPEDKADHSYPAWEELLEQMKKLGWQDETVR